MSETNGWRDRYDLVPLGHADNERPCGCRMGRQAHTGHWIAADPALARIAALEAEVERLRKLAKTAFHEGYGAHKNDVWLIGSGCEPVGSGKRWEQSFSRLELKETAPCSP